MDAERMCMPLSLLVSGEVMLAVEEENSLWGVLNGAGDGVGDVGTVVDSGTETPRVDASARN